jgi:hypothetical protein
VGLRRLVGPRRDRLEWTIKIILYSTTGQDFYRSTRPATLAGVDGIVFVADAQRSLLRYNQDSWKELGVFLATVKKDVPTAHYSFRLVVNIITAIAPAAITSRIIHVP